MRRAGPSRPLLSGAGILTEAGSLTVRKSTVTGNRSAVAPPNGRVATGAGIVAGGGTLTVTGAVVAHNASELMASMPTEANASATAGGINVGPNAEATVRGTKITGNTVTADNSVGDALAFEGGLNSEGSLVLRGSTVAGNRVQAHAAATSPTAASAFADS